MKQIKKLLLLILISFVFPMFVQASGGVSLSTSSMNLQKGSSKSFTIAANNAAGRVDVSSSNSSVASISATSAFLDNSSTTITINALSAGTAVITVINTDMATYDDEDISGKKYTITVNVIAPSSNNTPSNNTPSTNTPVSNKSGNNTLKKIEVEGYNLETKDGVYTLEVANKINKIKITAEAEDSKATIDGIGEKDLTVGKNDFTVSVKAENGSIKKYNLSITRKDGYYLEDLDSVLKDSEINDINLIIKTDSVMASSDLSKIKDSGKLVKLDYYDENKKLIYSWSIDGSKIKNTDNFLTSISYNSEHTKEISELSNYTDGISINFKHQGNLPEGTKVRIFVGDKYSDGSIVNVYYYNEVKKELDSVHNGLTVKEGYVEFDIEHCSEYFVTMANIKGINENNSNGINLFMIISIIELLIIIALVVVIVLMTKSKKDSKENKNNEEVTIINETIDKE